MQLASASSASPFAGNLTFPLVALGASAIAGILAFLVIRTLRVRRHPLASPLTALVLLWAIAAAGSAIWWTIQSTTWSSEQAMRLNTGYVDPRVAQPDAPAPPVLLWIILGCAYPLILMAAFSSRRTPAPETP